MMFSAVTATQDPRLGLWSQLAVVSPEVFLRYPSLTPVWFYRASDLLIFGVLACQSALVNAFRFRLHGDSCSVKFLLTRSPFPKDVRNISARLTKSRCL